MTSRIRPSSPGLAFQVAATTNATSLLLSETRAARSDGVAQDADAVALQLDHVSRPEPAAQPTPGAGGPRAAAGDPPGGGVEGAGRVADQRGEAVVHVGGGVAAPARPGDPHGQAQVADGEL